MPTSCTRLAPNNRPSTWPVGSGAAKLHQKVNLSACAHTRTHRGSPARQPSLSTSGLSCRCWMLEISKKSDLTARHARELLDPQAHQGQREDTCASEEAMAPIVMRRPRRRFIFSRQLTALLSREVSYIPGSIRTPSSKTLLSTAHSAARALAAIEPDSVHVRTNVAVGHGEMAR